MKLVKHSPSSFCFRFYVYANVLSTEAVMLDPFVIIRKHCCHLIHETFTTVSIFMPHCEKSINLNEGR